MDYPFANIIIINSHRTELSKLMAKRTSELDVKLLLYAIQRTANFESLLARRFTGVTLQENCDAPQQISSPQVWISLHIIFCECIFLVSWLNFLNGQAPSNTNPFEESSDSTNPFEADSGEESKSEQKPKPSPFHGLIGSCFDSYLYIYIESLDR